MPRTITKTVYKYDELPDDNAKEKARDWYRNASGSEFDSDCVIDDAETVLAFAGFSIGNIYWSGFASQGDGACFTGSWSAKECAPDKLKEHAPKDEELHRIADALALIAKNFPGMSLSLRHSGRYSHEQSVTGSASFGDDDPIETLEYNSAEYRARQKLLSAAEDEVLELARDAMRWVYRSLEREYEFTNSDEVVIDSIRANEYDFCESGERARHC